jgi:hypothetical protein
MSYCQHVGILILSFLPQRDTNRWPSIPMLLMLVTTATRTLRRLGARERRPLGDQLCVHRVWWRSCSHLAYTPVRHMIKHKAVNTLQQPLGGILLGPSSLALARKPLLQGILVYATTFSSSSLMLARLCVTNEPGSTRNASVI